ncbi:MAG: PAS domain S-box protein [Desulfuromusa sp.]|jgi:PAS domain S-box-containing protein|nr:PAS domain S-box protein [Desulfuromusa sp.]
MQNFNIETVSHQIVANAPDAILFSDREGIIRLWNRGAELVFGYSEDEALGQSLDLIIPEGLRKRHWDGYHRVMDTGESHYGTELLSVPAKHRNGQKLSCAFSIIMIKDELGILIGIASIMRDVTAAWEKERRLIKELEELKKQN